MLTGARADGRSTARPRQRCVAELPGYQGCDWPGAGAAGTVSLSGRDEGVNRGVPRRRQPQRRGSGAPSASSADRGAGAGRTVPIEELDGLASHPH